MNDVIKLFIVGRFLKLSVISEKLMIDSVERWCQTEEWCKEQREEALALTLEELHREVVKGGDDELLTETN